MIFRVYIDTSVIGGFYDEEFKEHSKRLFDDFEIGRFIPVISDITIAELRQAPEKVRTLLDCQALVNAEKVFFDEEAAILTESYIDAEVIGETNRVDAQHIAVATINHVDVLVSWNFQHIVKLSRIRAFNSVNLKFGWSLLEIRSPREVYYEE